MVAINQKIVVIFLSTLFGCSVYAMNNHDGQELVEYNSRGAGLLGMVTPYATSAWQGMSSFAAQSWDVTVAYTNSGLTTAQNLISDEAAFKKLGFPPSDPQAQEELKRCIVMYQQYSNCIANKNFSNDFAETVDFIGRRQEYLRRVVRALPHYPNNCELAQHCVVHHEKVLSPFFREFFVSFISKKTDEVLLCAEVLNEKEQKQLTNSSALQASKLVSVMRDGKRDSLNGSADNGKVIENDSNSNNNNNNDNGNNNQKLISCDDEK